MPFRSDFYSEKDIDHIISSYWSQGVVKIEIIDSERFNEDIFLGEVTLYLSNLIMLNSSQALTPEEPNNSNEKIQSYYRKMSGLYSVVNTPINVRSKNNSKLEAAIYLHLPISLISSHNNNFLCTPSINRKLTSSSSSSITNNTNLTDSTIRSPMMESYSNSSPSIKNNSNNKNKNTTNGDLKAGVSHPSNSGSAFRLRNLENVSVVLDFLQDSLQEEADIAMESLKSNYALMHLNKKRSDYSSHSSFTSDT
jgi:hypothetical protein